MVNDLDDVNSDMRLLALNARIEAARIGDLGKGFGVVAQHMTRSVDDIRNISAEIETLSNDILTSPQDRRRIGTAANAKLGCRFLLPAETDGFNCRFKGTLTA